MKAKTFNVVALDIGSSKITGFASYVDKQGKVTIISQTLQYSAGFQSSIITDLYAAEESILRTIYSLEQECEKSIKQVIISLSGSNTKSYYVTCQIKLPNQPITKLDIKKLTEKAIGEFKAQEQEIIAYFPIEFTLDDNNLVKNPIGMIGRELKCQLHIITVNSNLMLNLTHCLAKCHIEISSVILSVYASGLACLSDDEKNLGTMIIDMGARTTSFGIFRQGKLIYSDYLNLGGYNITSDIAKVFSLPLQTAEKLKILYGSPIITAFERDKVINLDETDIGQQDGFATSIPMHKLCAVIQARLEEILLKIKARYNQLDLDHLISKQIVITGGGATLKTVKEFTTKIFDRQVRIGQPIKLPGFSETHNPITYTALVGMLQCYSMLQQKNYLDGKILGEKNENWVNKTIKWFKENI